MPGAEGKCPSCLLKLQMEKFGQGHGQGQTLQGQGREIYLPDVSPGDVATYGGTLSLDGTLSLAGTSILEDTASLDSAFHHHAPSPQATPDPQLHSDDDFPPPLPPEREQDAYTGHVYDVVSDVIARGQASRTSSSSTCSRKPPPVPPTRRNSKPQPDTGRKAITPQLKRRFSIKDHHEFHRSIGEDR